MMNSPFKIYLFVLRAVLFTFFIFAQKDIGSPWISVKGKSNDEIKELISKESQNLNTYSKSLILEVNNQIKSENESRKTNFSDLKNQYRTNLDKTTDNKNDQTVKVNYSKEELAEVRSELESLNLKVSDLDSSTFLSNQIIKDEKSRIQDELTKIPFYEVMIAEVLDYSETGDVKLYDEKLEYDISRKAIENQLGIKVIDQTIISDGILEMNKVKTLLKGKVNANLKLYTPTIEDSETREISFKRVRYGLVTVFPFQDDDIKLKNKRKVKGIKTEVQTLNENLGGLASTLSTDERKKVRDYLYEKKTKNEESKNQIIRLSKTAKNLISLEKRKIEKNERKKVELKRSLDRLNSEALSLKKKLSNEEKILNKAEQEFFKSKKQYNNHILTENYIEVVEWSEMATSSQNIATEYAELAVESFNEFLSMVTSTYIKEETEVRDNNYLESKESTKTDVLVNEVKLLGKFAETQGRRTLLSIYIAYKFSFGYKEQVDDENHSVKNTFNNRKSKKPQKFNLSIKSKPSNVMVYTNGQKLGKTPLETYLKPNDYNLVFKKNGYGETMDFVDIKPEGVSRLNIELYKSNNPSQNGKKKYIIMGGVALVGGAAIFILNKDESQDQNKTGSVSISIDIP